MRKADAASKAKQVKKLQSRVFCTIDGLKSVKPAELDDFVREMTDHVIPEIVRVVEKRRTSAAESRRWQLKC